MSEFTIDENFWLLSNQESDISNLRDGLGQYIKNFEKATALEYYPIFLDTNVLLYFYKVSNKAKENFIKFVDSNINNVFITEQVKSEFLKSRIRVINNDYLNVLKDVPSQLEKNINSLTRFINSSKTLLSDYGDIYPDLKDVESSLLSILGKLDAEIKKDLEKNKNIKYNDPLLNTYSKISVVKNLSSNELEFLKKKFDSLANQDSIVYPGMSDNKKRNNSIGDFIIFHEIMKYMKQESTSVTFLTNDTKEDWFEIDGKGKKHPFIPYIESTFNNTRNFNYILDANRNLSEILKIEIKTNTYLKTWHKQKEILKQKTLVHEWIDEIFLDSIHDDYLDDFSVPISQVEFTDNVELSDIDFDMLLDSSESSADFYGSGNAFNTSTDTDDNKVTYYIDFNFYGSCNINIQDRTVDIYDLQIDESEVEVHKDTSDSINQETLPLFSKST